MLCVSETIDLNAPAAAVWQTVGDFGAAARYLDAVERCDLQDSRHGTERVLHLKDGGMVRERLVLASEDDQALRYTIVESPLPVNDYVSTVRVDALDDEHCRVTWASTFDARDASDDDAQAAIVDIYRMGLDGLRRLHDLS